MFALDGINILDLTWQGPGPLATMMLGDLGAEIIQIRAAPTAGARQEIRVAGQRAVAYQAVSRNKRSLLLDLKSEEGRQIFHRLAREADVIVDGFRPGVTERLGIDYATISRINPRIIYCAITGYGQDGPYRDLPGHDINYISTAGVLNLIGEADRQPVVPLNLIADYGAGGKDAVIGILGALVARGKTGRGQYIDISLTDSAISLLTESVLSPYFQSGVEPGRGDHVLGGATPAYNIYQTKDGKYITIGCLEPWLWENFCRAIGKEEFTAYQSERDKWAEVTAHLKQLFLTRTRDEWFDFLCQQDVPVGKVYSLDEVFTDPQVVHRRMVIELEHPAEGTIRQVGFAIKLSDTPGQVRSLPPLPGEHTEEILLSLGYGRGEVERLRREGVIG
ncbi:MAG: CoA transferase [Dehalococcoidales bacterium]|nr:MAG: CoA transferase [Dehalococcoidales bacterium]